MGRRGYGRAARRDLYAAVAFYPTRTTAVTVRYLVDTDWVIHYLKGRRPFVEHLQGLLGQGLAMSVITLGELYEGVYGAAEPDKREQGLKDFLQGVAVIGLDEETCRIFGKE